MQIDLRDNFPEVKRLLGSQQRQMPFALSLAINRTAQDVRKAEREQIGAVFDRPTRYTLNSLYIKPSTKTDLTARVWVKDSERPNHYLLPQIVGGARPLKRFEAMLVQRGVMRSNERAVPGNAAKLDAFGNMSRGQIVKILSQLKAFATAGFDANATDSRRSRAKRTREAYFVSTGVGTHPFGGHSWSKGRMAQHLPRGVWVRTPHDVMGSKVAPVLLFVSRASYRVLFRFEEVAQATVRRVLPRHLDAAVAQALRTARPGGGSA